MTDWTSTPPPRRKGVNHVLHAILSLLTGGLWLFVWLFLVLKERNHPCG